jgi:hypothetical protein
MKNIVEECELFRVWVAGVSAHVYMQIDWVGMRIPRNEENVHTCTCATIHSAHSVI